MLFISPPRAHLRARHPALQPERCTQSRLAPGRQHRNTTWAIPENGTDRAVPPLRAPPHWRDCSNDEPWSEGYHEKAPYDRHEGPESRAQSGSEGGGTGSHAGILGRRVLGQSHMAAGGRSASGERHCRGLCPRRCARAVPGRRRPIAVVVLSTLRTCV